MTASINEAPNILGRDPTGESIRVCSTPLRLVTLEAAVSEIINDAQLSGKRRNHFHLVNAFSLACASRDLDVAAAFGDGARNYPDGTPLVWASRKRRPMHSTSAVRGPSLFRAALDQGRRHRLSHFFLGSTGRVLSSLLCQVQADNPGIVVAGSYSPPMGDLSGGEWKRICAEIRRTNPDLVWVGMGTPRQDLVARRLTEELGVTAVAVGAAFDFVAGTRPEAPGFLQGTGLEWAFRLATEPRRLWRRYVFGNTRYLALELLTRKAEMDSPRAQAGVEST